MINDHSLVIAISQITLTAIIIGTISNWTN